MIECTAQYLVSVGVIDVEEVYEALMTSTFNDIDKALIADKLMRIVNDY